jgi:hypothetical protein
MKLAIIGALALACGSGDTSPMSITPKPLPAISLDTLCATHGDVHIAGERAQVRDPEVRAFARATHGDAAALAFTYLGPSDTTSTLASGDVRAQLGLKLRAADGCNLVYVMWRFEPKPSIVVQVKRNAGQHTAKECGANGYTRIKAAKSAKVAAPAVGSEHVLQAEIDGDDLIAWADGNVVWQGRLGGQAGDLAGPVGVRADNVQADIALRAIAGSGFDRCPKDRDASE